MRYHVVSLSLPFSPRRRSALRNCFGLPHFLPPSSPFRHVPLSSGARAFSECDWSLHRECAVCFELIRTTVCPPLSLSHTRTKTVLGRGGGGGGGDGEGLLFHATGSSYAVAVHLRWMCEDESHAHTHTNPSIRTHAHHNNNMEPRSAWIRHL